MFCMNQTSEFGDPKGQTLGVLEEGDIYSFTLFTSNVITHESFQTNLITISTFSGMY